jgi:hypothetical protein
LCNRIRAESGRFSLALAFANRWLAHVTKHLGEIIDRFGQHIFFLVWR